MLQLVICGGESFSMITSSRLESGISPQKRRKTSFPGYYIQSKWQTYTFLFLLLVFSRGKAIGHSVASASEGPVDGKGFFVSLIQMTVKGRSGVENENLDATLNNFTYTHDGSTGKIKGKKKKHDQLAPNNYKLNNSNKSGSVSKRRKPFKPNEKYTFKNVDLSINNHNLGLRDTNGSLLGKFTLINPGSHILLMLNTVSGSNGTECKVKWAPPKKKVGEGLLRFYCEYAAAANGYSGRVPIEVHMVGLSGSGSSKILLEVDGYTFSDIYGSLAEIKHAILSAMGTNFEHDCVIKSVNGKKYKKDQENYDAILRLVKTGVKQIKLRVQMMIKLLIGIKEPFSQNKETIVHDMGNLTLREYLKTLKDSRKLDNMVKENLGKDAAGFTLFSINDTLNTNMKGISSKLLSMPIDTDMKWIFMPHLEARFYYLYDLAGSKAFPVGTPLNEIINAGKKLLKSHFRKKLKVVFELYGYSLPGCQQEDAEINNLTGKGAPRFATDLLFAETCLNRKTNILELYYYNEKPKDYSFCVEIENPDGTRSEKKKVTMKYVKSATVANLKGAIVASFGKDGHLISGNDLSFTNLGASDGSYIRENTKIKDLTDIVKDQKMGKMSKLLVRASPKIKCFFTDANGRKNIFYTNLKTTHPRLADVMELVREELLHRGLLGSNGFLSPSLWLRPLDKKGNPKGNADIGPGENGFFPPGTNIDKIAVVGDSNVLLSVSFSGENGQTSDFKIKVPYGAPGHILESLIREELERRGFGKGLQQLSAFISGSNVNFGDIWNGKAGNVTSIEVKPTKLVDVEGTINGSKTKIHLGIHPGETVDQLESDILGLLRLNPEYRKTFGADPKRLDGISTLITSNGGKIYSDGTANNLYNDVDSLMINISDVSLNLLWMDPNNGSEAPICLYRENGQCRGLPFHALFRLSLSALIDLLVDSMKNDGSNSYENKVISSSTKNPNLLPLIKLAKIEMSDGARANCDELRFSDKLSNLETVCGLSLNRIKSLIFTLMTLDEESHFREIAKTGGAAYRLAISKLTGNEESHFMTTGDLGHNGLLDLIYKYFYTVPRNARLVDIKVDGKEYDGKPLSKFIGPNNGDITKVTFGVEGDHKQDKNVTLKVRGNPVKIQPKPDETLRQYFLRSLDSPHDYGLSPLHSLGAVFLDENGKPMTSENLIDTPIGSLDGCKEILLEEVPLKRLEDTPKIFMQNLDSKKGPKSSILLDGKSGDIYDMNSKLRKFLLNIPSDELDLLTIRINGKPVKCSLNSLKNVYTVKYITLEGLLYVCGVDPGESHQTVIELSVDGSRKGSNESDRERLISGLEHVNHAPIAYITLKMGQTNLGISSLLPITDSSLGSPINDFYSKLRGMFGPDLGNFHVSLAVTKNDKYFPCNSSENLKGLESFKILTLGNIFLMCGIPKRVPESGTFYHFYVIMQFGEDIVSTSNETAGYTLPFYIEYKDSELMSTLSADEDLKLRIYNFMRDNPDIDPSNLSRYSINLSVQGDNDSIDTRSYNLGHLPDNMSLSKMFRFPVKHVTLKLEDTNDDFNSSGGWKTGLSYPSEDYKDNFEKIKKQLIFNLKRMHGNGLDSLSEYKFYAGINGEKHQCHIKNLKELEKMTLSEFITRCVNVDSIHNNQLLSLNVRYDSPKTDAKFNLKFICEDLEHVNVSNLGHGDSIPADVLKILMSKYGIDKLGNVQWGVSINGMRGSCHINKLNENFKMLEILERCGSDGDSSSVYYITFRDLSIDYRGPVNNKVTIRSTVGRDRGGQIPGAPPMYPSGLHLIGPTSGISDTPPNIFINMPQSYGGPKIDIDGDKSLEDYVKEVILNEDVDTPGKPLNIKLYMDGHPHAMNDVPGIEFNYPSGYLNGNISILVDEDDSGSMPGTLNTIHLPDRQKPLGEFIRVLKRNIPNIENKTIMLVNKDAILKENNIPQHLLHMPMSELRKRGFVLSILNGPENRTKKRGINVTILSEDGTNGTKSISNLQETVRELFIKILGDKFSFDGIKNAHFRIILDSMNVNCPLPPLDLFLSSVTLQDLLLSCGVSDLDGAHDLTLFFDSSSGNEHNGKGPLKFNFDLGGEVGNTESIGFGHKLDLGGKTSSFLKQKKNGYGVFVDVKDKDGEEDFIEVDTKKFLGLLDRNPNVLEFLLRMGVPQDKLGGVDSLKIIIESLSTVLRGHQSFTLNGSKSVSFSDFDQLSKHKELSGLLPTLNKDRDGLVKVIVKLLDGNVIDFTVSNREFAHAIKGGLSFKDLVVWGTSPNAAMHIKSMAFDVKSA